MGEIGEINVDGRPVKLILRNDQSHVDEETGETVHYSTLGWKFLATDGGPHWWQYMVVSDPHISPKAAMGEVFVNIIEARVRDVVGRVANSLTNRTD